MTAEDIGLLNAALTLGLVLLTGAYVFLTHRLIVHTRKANDENIAVQTLHTRLAYFPKLSCRISEVNGEVILTVSNPCDHPAYDVEAFVVLSYDQDDIDVPTFSVSYLSDEGRRLRVEPTDDGFFGVFSVAAYADFPGRKKVDVVLDTPMFPGYVYILIQFKDIMGFNYAQTYWFFGDAPHDPHTFKLGSLAPAVPTPIPRIERDRTDYSVLVMSDKSDINSHVDQEFTQCLKASFPTGYLKAATRSVEDRGRWSVI